MTVDESLILGIEEHKSWQPFGERRAGRLTAPAEAEVYPVRS